MNTISRILSILADDPEAAVLAVAVFAAGVAVALGLLAQLVRVVASGLSAAELPRAAAVAARIADGLLASGLHLRELARAGRGLGPVAQSLPPPPPPAPKDDDDDVTPIGPKAPPKIVTLSVLVLTFAGCAGLGCGSPISSAIVVANASRDAGEVAAEQLQTRCVDGYRAAGDLADVARLDGECLPLRDAYRELRGAHLGLVVAIQVAQARGDLAALVPAVAATVEASELVAAAVAEGAR